MVVAVLATLCPVTRGMRLNGLDEILGDADTASEVDEHLLTQNTSEFHNFDGEIDGPASRAHFVGGAAESGFMELLGLSGNTIRRARFPGGKLPSDVCSTKVKWRFSRGRKLGRGSFGKVFEAAPVGTEGTDPGMQFVLKKVMWKECPYKDRLFCDHKMFGFDPIELEPMRLKLPFVADLEAVFQKKDKVWIAARRFAGGSLRSHLEFYPEYKALAEVRTLAAQMAYGLWQMHRQGFIHGDVKLDNVLLADPGSASQRLALADFGVTTANCGPTACTSQFQGTPGYMAPNILKRQGYGFEVDWWAFGITVAAMTHSSVFASTGDVIRGKAPERFGAFKKIVTYDPLFQFLTRILNADKYSHLATDEMRAAMMSAEPADHPILSDSFWFDSSTIAEDRAAINDFWRGICEAHVVEGISCTEAPWPRPLCPLPCSTTCDFSTKYSTATTARLKLREICVHAEQGAIPTGKPGKEFCMQRWGGYIHRGARLTCCICLASPECADSNCSAHVCDGT